MRRFYFFALAFGFVVFVASFVVGSPDIAHVDSDKLDGWYFGLSIADATLCAIAGVILSRRTRNTLRYSPTADSGDFAEHVIKRGVTGMFAGVLLAVGVGALFAATSGSFALGLLQRVVELVFGAIRMWLIALGGGFLFSGLSYLIESRRGKWGGAYAFLPPRIDTV